MVYCIEKGDIEMEPLSARIYARRVELGSVKHPLSLRAAALEIGVSLSTLCRVESGKDCRSSAYCKIEAWLSLVSESVEADGNAKGEERCEVR